LKKTIADAFVKANLALGSTAKDAALKSAAAKRNAAVSELFNTDEQDAALAKRQKLGDAADAEIMFTPAAQHTIATITLPSSISPEHPNYHLVMDVVTEKFFTQSTVVPVQQLRMELERQRKNKKSSIPKAAVKRSLKNPDTTTGLGVTENMLLELEHVEQAKRDAAEAKEKKRETDELKKLDARVADKIAGEEVIALHAHGGKGAWEKLKGDKLKSAYKYITKKEVKNIRTDTGSAPRKADIVAAIAESLICPEESTCN
jgi:hypothetical protein